jgi:hypothetical protein
MQTFGFLLLLLATFCPFRHSHAMEPIVAVSASPMSPDEQARQFITHLYQEYYLRFPNSAEVESWMREYRKGNSLEEIHAAFLGSDEYYTRMQRNDSIWFNGMYLTVANRQPTSDVITYWSNRLRQYNGDRRRLAREFLRSQMGGSNLIPIKPEPGQLPNLPSNLGLPAQLVTSSQQLVQSVRNEFSGWNRTVLQLQANALSDMARQSQTTLQNAANDPVAARAAWQRVNAALQGLNRQFETTSGGTNSRAYLDQINRQVRAIGEMLPTGGGILGPTYPPIYPPVQEVTLSRQDAQRISGAAASLADKTKQTYWAVQDLARYDYRYSSFVNDIGQLVTEIQTVSNGIYEGMPASRLRKQAEAIRTRMQSIGGRMQNQAVDVRLSQSWFAAVLEFDKFWAEIGGQGTGFPGSTGNVVDWTRVQALQKPTDQALSYCDALLFQYGSYYYYGTPYAKFVDEVRALRSSLNDFRANLNYNTTNTTIQNKLNNVNTTLRAAEQAWTDLQRQPGIIGSDGFANLSNSIRELMIVASGR